MKFVFTEDQLQFQDTMRGFLSQECTPDSIRSGWVDKQPLNQQRWNAIAELGVLGANLSEEDGGLGVDQVALALMVEEMGYVALPEPIAEQSFLINDVLHLFPDQIQDAIRAEFNEGKEYIAVSHPQNPHPVFLSEAKGLIMIDETSCHFVKPSDVSSELIKSNDPSRVLSRILGVKNTISSDDNFQQLNQEINSRGTLLTASLLLGLSQKMLDLSSAYVLDRNQFGKPIGSFQAVKHMLADIAVAIEFARPAVYRASYSLLETNPKSALHCAHAKYMAVKAAELACKNSIQAHGAMGYTWEMDLHIYMRKSWSLMACWGNDDYQQNIIFNTLRSSDDELGVLYTF
ncbi:acyl-CoA/acyl-ACP dehydrogenase [Gammaproteobacteria bacterium]|nr:acyl-CoA/acyl-ACP dehydrogenase [Gammaproteobacteria bacterium]MDA8924518.1 acyl-CoA/acyl-ACP dehydrogenase [Gammaproteobacteria bacterium]MDA9049119.1 acyl-CoA/acyl-ACP dehydrogenase [Gammaproteobacteria bacterium]MDA9154057.1 acyl-CoA/acyl-ACP dehydrogenase [Gammaproteobacteria bacterium]MDA9973979.1 acyl-CoA/acyl-ACP dehydrogenase [Gammaproteobacteria bacterium]